MIVFKRGGKMPPKYLTAVLREQHEQSAENQRKRLAKRAERGAPSSDEPPCETCGKVEEEEPIGDFAGYDRLDGLRVTFKALPVADVRSYRLDLMSFAAAVQDDDGELSYDLLKKSERAAAKTKREAVCAMVAAIDGLANEDGSDLVIPAGDSLSEDELDLLEDNDILDALFAAGLHLQDLSDEARKNCGALQRSISGPTTATPAQDNSDSPEAATTETGRAAMIATSGLTTSATTPPAYARSGSSSETPLSAPSSNSPDSSAMQA